ncbi:MAG TPA: glycosyltransferase [Bacteroidales bacterium]|nr:glycosyltransferase [Bacteroidales bacterium]
MKKGALKNKTVLICPLDWGIGHATRCVPVIRIFLKHGYRVVIAASGRPLAFLKKEFPDLPCLTFPGTPIRYPQHSGFTWRMMQVAPRFLAQIYIEHRRLRHILDQVNPGVVVSDNRYGLWTKRCYTILITHQLSLEVPRGLRWARPLLSRLIRHLASRFNACWIPDVKQPFGLAGKLSHPAKLPPNALYTGILSRFNLREITGEPPALPRIEILVLLSGPEPQRSILEQKLITQLMNTDLKTAIVRGVTEEDTVADLAPHIRVYSHLETHALKELISDALIVICRSGYSSIMDLVSMGKRAIFIPTPGQTEQEYLARYLMEKKIYFSMTQENFDLIYALELSRNYPGMVLGNDYRVLDEAVRDL